MVGRAVKEFVDTLHAYGITLEQANRMAEQGCRIFEMARDLSEYRKQAAWPYPEEESWNRPCSDEQG